MNTRSEFKCRAENITAGETRLQNLNDHDEGLNMHSEKKFSAIQEHFGDLVDLKPAEFPL
jgi:hypothetical protein